jgi:hypothetical protein
MASIPIPPAARQFCLGLLALGLVLARAPLAAQDVPLEYCDRLPAIRVQVAGHQSMLFLVDTAATSLLNLRSFALGDARDVAISSYRGTSTARGREVSPPEIKIGSYHLVGVKMMAIDLSELGGCGRRIDGILGADLLERMGATIDFDRGVVHFMTAEERRSEQLIGEASRDVTRCLSALDAGDENPLRECFASQITLLEQNASIYSPDQALAWLREHQHAASPPGSPIEIEAGTHIEAHAANFHAVGEAVWFEYEVNFHRGADSSLLRGVAMCRKAGGSWRIAGISPAEPKE